MRAHTDKLLLPRRRTGEEKQGAVSPCPTPRRPPSPSPPSTNHFLKAVFAAIQSESIRAWAQTPHNAPIVKQMAKEALKKNPNLTPQYFATYLTTVAMAVARECECPSNTGVLSSYDDHDTRTRDSGVWRCLHGQDRTKPLRSSGLRESDTALCGRVREGSLQTSKARTAHLQRARASMPRDRDEESRRHHLVMTVRSTRSQFWSATDARRQERVPPMSNLDSRK